MAKKQKSVYIDETLWEQAKQKLGGPDDRSLSYAISYFLKLYIMGKLEINPHLITIEPINDQPTA